MKSSSRSKAAQTFWQEEFQLQGNWKTRRKKLVRDEEKGTLFFNPRRLNSYP